MSKSSISSDIINGMIKPEEFKALIPKLLRDLAEGFQTGRQDAADGLGAMGTAAQEAVPALIAAFNDPIPFVRWRAAVAVWEITGNPAIAVPVLTDILKTSSDYLTRSGVSFSLIKVKPKDSKVLLPVYLDMLKDDDADIRRDGIVGMVELGTDAHAAIDAIVKMKDDPAGTVREAALKALEKMKY